MNKKLAIVLALVAVVCILAACQPQTNPIYVTFDAQNGTDPVVVKFDENFALPEAPQNGDLVFAGWHIDPQCTEKWNYSTDKNITVYAKWDQPQQADDAVYVYFDAQNGTDPVAVKFDENFALPETPQNGTMLFGGWYEESSCDTPWEAPQTLSQSITVYARWIDVADLSTVFEQYNSYDKWNFSIHYTLTADSDGTVYYDQQQKLFGADISITYADYYGNQVTDYLAYDLSTQLFTYYADNGDGSFAVFSEEDSAFLDYYYNVGLVELTTLGELSFYLDGDSYIAVDAEAAGNAIFGEWQDSLWYEVRIFVEEGKISQIKAIQLDTGDYSSGSYTFVAQFSSYGASEFSVPEVSVENDPTLVQIFNLYQDDSAWNFTATYDMLEGGVSVYDAVLSYMGVNVEYTYLYETDYYTDYLAYDSANNRWMYIEDIGDGTYEVYYSDDEETSYYFEIMYYYMDYIDLTTLNSIQFVAEGEGYAAKYPNGAGKAIFGDMGVNYQSLTLQLADGFIYSITAVLEPYQEEGETYNYTIKVQFSNYGKVNFTLPNVDGGGSGSGDVDTDPNTSVFVDASLATQNANSVQYTTNKTGYGFDENRGVQFLQQYGDVTLTSQSSFVGVTSVTLTLATNAPSGANISVTVGGVSLVCNGQTTHLLETTTYAQVTFTSSQPLDGVLAVTLGATQTSKSMYISQISVVCNGSSSGNVGGDTGGGSGGDVTTPDTMPNQVYDEQTFDNSNLQDKMFQYEEQQYGSGAIGLPAVGTYSALVVPIQFGGNTLTSQDLQQLNIAFNGNQTETGWQSVSTYYAASSYGKLNLSFDIWNFNTGTTYGNFTAANSANYYASLQDPSGALLKEVLQWLVDKIDLSKYDTNNDGYIDAVYLIYDYEVDYVSDDTPWWAYVMWYSGEETYDGLYAYYYLFAGLDFMLEDVAGGNEVSGVIGGLKVNAATYIHETGHLLGLDDYYDYNTGTGSDRGLGGADMMDYTVGDHNVYSKIMLGWITPTVITQTTTFTIDLSDADTTNNCIMLLLDSNNSYFCEYLLIDLYSATGLNQLHAQQTNSYLYGGAQSGVRIYHVYGWVNNPYSDEYYSFTDNNNSLTQTPLLTLVEADGESSKTSENGGAWSEASDLWQAGDVFSTVYSAYTRQDGKVVNFDISIDSVSSTSATVTVTFATAA